MMSCSLFRAVVLFEDIAEKDVLLWYFFTVSTVSSYFKYG